MSNDDIRQLIEKIFENVDQAISKEEWTYCDLFLTNRGNRLGRTLLDVEEFTIKGIFLSLFWNILTKFPRLSFEWMQSNDFDEMMQGKISDSDLDLINAIQISLGQDPHIFDEIESDSFFKVEDHMRFFAYYVFAVYAYLDGYVQELIDEIKGKLIIYLNKSDEPIKSNFLKILGVTFKTERSRSYDRIKTLLKSFQVSKTFNSCLKEFELITFEVYFQEFIH